MFAKALLLGACAALAAAQSSVLSFTHVPDPMTDGEQQAILFQTNDTTTPATILLRKGPSGNLQTVETVTTNAVNGQYIWTPSQSLADGDNYALEIKQGTQVNYYGPFQIQGANPKAVSSASAAAAKSSGSSSSGSSSGSASATSTKNSTATSDAHSSTMTGHNSTMSSMTSSMMSSHNSSMMMTTTGSSMHGKTTVAPVSTTAAPMSSAAKTSASASSTPTTSTNGAVTLGSSFVLGLGAVAAFVALL